MHFRLLIRRRLKELGGDQKVLAEAAGVTESYISQLLNQRKLPPAPERTDLYDRMEKLLRLPAGHPATLAGVQRQDALNRQLTAPPRPLFREVRELILHKCLPKAQHPIPEMFEREPFGALERLVTQTLLNACQRVVREGAADETWLRRVAHRDDRRYEQMRVMVLEFLETDVFTLSANHCVTFLDPLVASWDIDLATFAIEIVLNRHLVAEHTKKFEFVERGAAAQVSEQAPGLQAFLLDPSLSGDATAEEFEFLKTLRLRGERPTPLYYYRELQNLRDRSIFTGRGRSRPAAILSGGGRTRPNRKRSQSMADRQALTVNDVVVSKVHEGHQLLIVTADPSDQLSLVFRGHQWSVPYAVARGARLAGRKGGHLWYTADDSTTFDYLETFRRDPSGVSNG